MDRIPELDELVMQDERAELAQSMDVDIIERSAGRREQHTPAPSSERGRSSKASRAGRSSP
eukprot:3950607-Pyramimonas_sp.AAC.1